MIRLFGVAELRMIAVSVISTMKVDRPRARLSEAPIRVKILSKIGNRISWAGTKEPICARMTRSAFCLRNVDLPPIFGPVTIKI